MKMKRILLVVFVLAVAVAAAWGASYKSLWRQASAFEKKDLPRSAVSVMQDIQTKARREKAYGQLMSATLKEIYLWGQISPDSIQPLFNRFVACRDSVDTPVLKALYDAVLYDVLKNNRFLESEYKPSKPLEGADDAFLQTLQRTPVTDVAPLVSVGTLARYVGNDMLGVIGYETDDFKSLHDFFVRHGNREGALLCQLEMLKQTRKEKRYAGSRYKMQLDSLEQCYGDLDLCGAVAEERLHFMSYCSDVTVKEKIDTIHSALKRWKSYINVNELKNRETELTLPLLNVTAKQNMLLTDRDFWLMMPEIRNIHSATVSISGQGRKVKYEKTFAPHSDYEMFRDSMLIKGLPAGEYEIRINTIPECEQYDLSEITVSNIFTVTEMLPDKKAAIKRGHSNECIDCAEREQSRAKLKVRIAVLDASTGQPMQDAHVDVTYGYGDNSQVKTFSTGADGELLVDADIDGNSMRDVYAYTDTDKSERTISGRPSANFNIKTKKKEITNIFTDRSIYRPGQTVHVSAITSVTDDDSTYAVSGRKQTITLRDVSRQEIKTDTCTTDDFGTVVADFVLPTDAKNGRYSVSVGSTIATFRVEEYKRPTFEIIFPEITKKYAAGDTLMVYAKVRTFAGAPVRDAKVVYTIKRKMPLWWWRNDYDNDGINLSDSLVTDADGGCFIPVQLTVPQGNRHFYNFVADVTVTSLGGETQRGQFVVPLGYKDAVLKSDMKTQILRDSLHTVIFTLYNASGKEMESMVTYSINGGKERTAATGKPADIDLTSITIGENSLRAICEGDTLQQTFTVFGIDDTHPCCNTDGWFWVSSDEFPQDATPVTVQVGTSLQDVHILYSISADNGLIEKGAIDLSDSLWNRKFVYKEEYGNGLFIHFGWVKDGRWKEFSATIRKPLPKRKLQLEWATFRDRLTPGQKEEWHLKVNGADTAQLLCTLYDKSLDMLYPHSWNMNLGLSRATVYSYWNYTYPYGWYHRLVGMGKEFPVNAMTWNRFDENFTIFQQRVYSLAKVVIRGTSALKSEKMNYDVLGYGVRSNRAESDATATADTGLRTNLAETAFFYPQIHTDNKSMAVIKFTLPESLTTWRFLGLAHSKDMHYGMIEDDIIAKKEVMIQPNVPRFIRMGDKAMLAATVVNTSGKKYSGVAYMELIDPETQKTIYSRKQSFSIDREKTVSVSFIIDTDKLPSDASLYICRVHADGKGFSDGEQHYLPVLPDRETITATYPVTQHGVGETTVALSTLIPQTVSKASVTIDYVSNPSWMIIRSLPTMATPADDDVISHMQAYYSNKLTKHLLDNNPQVRTILSWKQDADTLTRNIDATLAKIQSLQLSDGSWAWFKGMEGSRLITLAVVEALVRMNILTGQKDKAAIKRGQSNDFIDYAEREQSRAKLKAAIKRGQSNDEMIRRGLLWLANDIHKDIAEMKKDNVRYVSSLTLQYLYTCMLAGVVLPTQAQEDNEWMLSVLKKAVKDRTVFEKALTATILNRHGEKSLAREYVQSLKEWSVYREDMGRYYDTPRAGYTWRDYKIPTEVAAIEAISNITPEDIQTVEEMQRWLLQEKRTQSWTTPANTIDAIYAFMLNGQQTGGELQVFSACDEGVERSESRDELAQSMPRCDGRRPKVNNATALDNGTAADILLDGKTTAIEKYPYTISETPNTITFRHTSDGTGWGAVYARYLQPVKDVESSSSGFTVTRTMMSDTYKVGDRVKVRITVTADRDYDFVQVVDKRAACMEPVRQLSGYSGGAYVSTKDTATHYSILKLTKGTHTFETEYYIDRAGTYQYAPVTVQCAYAPEFSAHSKTDIIEVK